MKHWWGYLTAAIFAAFSWMLMELGEKYSQLIDMVYPYVTRSVQTFLSTWTGSVDALVWQVIVVAFVLVALAGIVLTVIFKQSLIRYVGWVLAVVSIVFFLHTGIYGLNYNAGPLADDIRMEMEDYTQSDLELAAKFYREKANGLSTQMERDGNGALVYPGFAQLAQTAGDGFANLVSDRSYSVFAGDRSPVKELGWADMYSSMGITGFTCFLTGEAAVNPQIPVQALPFTMCHEMAHRMCIAREDDANFAGFLACQENEAIEFQYSAYFMAYRYCYNALNAVDSVAASEIAAECTPELLRDLTAYSDFFTTRKDETAEKVADTVNDTYLKVSGDDDGVASYGAVCDQLVNWYLSQYATPEELGEEQFDPLDENQVDLEGIGDYYVPSEPSDIPDETTEETTEAAE